MIELALNSLDYLCLEPHDLNLIQLLSDCYTYTSDVQETFEKETLSVSVCKNSKYMGMWQLMAASNVFNCKIFSSYPELGLKKFNFFNRCITPRSCSNSVHTIVLFWSATPEHHDSMPEENWTANHVVPLMGMTRDIAIVCDDN